jgi:hypothetical protein
VVGRPVPERAVGEIAARSAFELDVGQALWADLGEQVHLVGRCRQGFREVQGGLVRAQAQPAAGPGKVAAGSSGGTPPVAELVE